MKTQIFIHSDDINTAMKLFKSGFSETSLFSATPEQLEAVGLPKDFKWKTKPESESFTATETLSTIGSPYGRGRLPKDKVKEEYSLVNEFQAQGMRFYEYALVKSSYYSITY